MKINTVSILSSIGNDKCIVFTVFNNTAITYLTARLSVERSFIKHNSTAFACAEHINKFWTRRMRDDLRALVERDPAAVDPLVLAAAGRIRPGQAAPSA